MGWQSAAKHYKVSQSVARFLVKIVDANLKEAGIDSWSINGPRPSMFTKNDDRLVGELIEKEHAESGKAKVRPGFWEKINNGHFAGRGLTAKMLERRRGNVLSRRKKRLSSSDARESSEPFTDAEDVIIRDAVARQIQESGTDRLPHGFWPSVIETNSMRRDSHQLSKRW